MHRSSSVSSIPSQGSVKPQSSSHKGMQRFYTKIRNLRSSNHKTKESPATPIYKKCASEDGPEAASASGDQCHFRRTQGMLKHQRVANRAPSAKDENAEESTDSLVHDAAAQAAVDKLATSSYYMDSDDDLDLSLSIAQSSLEDEIFQELEKAAHDEGKLNAVLRNFDTILTEHNSAKIQQSVNASSEVENVAAIKQEFKTSKQAQIEAFIQEAEAVVERQKRQMVQYGLNTTDTEFKANKLAELCDTSIYENIPQTTNPQNSQEMPLYAVVKKENKKLRFKRATPTVETSSIGQNSKVISEEMSNTNKEDLCDVEFRKHAGRSAAALTEAATFNAKYKRETINKDAKMGQIKPGKLLKSRSYSSLWLPTKSQAPKASPTASPKLQQRSGSLNNLLAIFTSSKHANKSNKHLDNYSNEPMPPMLGHKQRCKSKSSWELGTRIPVTKASALKLRSKTLLDFSKATRTAVQKVEENKTTLLPLKKKIPQLKILKNLKTHNEHTKKESNNAALTSGAKIEIQKQERIQRQIASTKPKISTVMPTKTLAIKSAMDKACANKVATTAASTKTAAGLKLNFTKQATTKTTPTVRFADKNIETSVTKSSLMQTKSNSNNKTVPTNATHTSFRRINSQNNSDIMLDKCLKKGKDILRIAESMPVMPTGEAPAKPARAMLQIGKNNKTSARAATKPKMLQYAEDVPLAQPKLESCRVIPPVLGETSTENSKRLVQVVEQECEYAKIIKLQEERKQESVPAKTNISNDTDSDDSGLCCHTFKECPQLQAGTEKDMPAKEQTPAEGIGNAKLLELLAKFEDNKVEAVNVKVKEKIEAVESNSRRKKANNFVTRQVAEIEAFLGMESRLEVIPWYHNEVKMNIT